MQVRTTLALSFVSVLIISSLAPSLATAGWQGATGAEEPNTEWDTTAYMFADANTDLGADGKGVDKLYLNGFVIHDDLLVSPVDSYDANLHGGSIITPISMRFAGMLGFWRDCNGDGYIGARGVPASLGSFSVYPRAAFAIDTDVCPLGSPYNAINVNTGEPNGYIDEFRSVGPGFVPPSTGRLAECNAPPVPVRCATDRAVITEDPGDVDDQDAKVWVDWGYPGARHIPHQGLTAQPPGTYDDSDGTLGYVDDALQRQFSESAGPTWNSKPNIGACERDDPKFLGGADGTCGLWVGYQAERLIDDRADDHDESEELVTVFDNDDDSDGDGNPCNDGASVPAELTAPGASSPLLNGIQISDVQPAVNEDPLVSGSSRGTLINFWTGTNFGNVTNQAPMTQCNPNGGAAAGSPESETLDAEFTHRIASDYLSYTPDQRYRTLGDHGFDYAPGDLTGTGVRSGPVSPASDSPGWYGTFGWTGRPPRTGWGSVSNAYATFYADLSSAAFVNAGADPAVAIPAGGQDRHVYGSEFCESFTTGPSNVNAANLWECSLTEWENKRQADYDAAPNDDILVRPILGAPYDLRDADCYDNSVSDQLEGVRAGLAACDV